MTAAYSPKTARVSLDEAASIVRAGGLVAMPTETVYGLAADAENDLAVARIFEAKGRPRFNPLIIHIATTEEAERLAAFTPIAARLAEAFWPGPLTLVLPRRAGAAVSLLASAGLDTIALRRPAHPIAQALLGAVGRPLAAPSANPSGAISPTTADHVLEGLAGKIGGVLDGGPCSVGVESSIVKFDGARATLLRPGGVSAEDIERALSVPLLRPGAGVGVEAPGMLTSHYAPRSRLRINVETPRADEVFLAFGAAPARAAATIELSAARNLTEAAALLFAALRRADALVASAGLAGIAVAPIPDDGLGEAINDRLARAAAGTRSA